MKSLCRRFTIGALILCLSFGSIGISTPKAEAGLPSIPKIPKIPGVSGLTPVAIQALLQNRTAQQELIGLVTWLAKHGYVVKSVSYDSLTGVLTVFSKNAITKQTRSDSIFLFGDQGGTATVK